MRERMRVAPGLWLLSLPLIGTPVLSDEGPTLRGSFNLNYLLKIPVSKYRHIGG